MSTNSDKPQSQVNLTVSLPDELLSQFLQHIRDFEAGHFEDVTITMNVDAPHMKVSRLEEIMRSIDPPFATMLSIRRGDA